MGSAALEPGMVSKAIGVYLQVAYPGGAPKKILAIYDNLLNWQGDLYANPAFERPDDGGQACYALRLGCAHYPHMKLLVGTWAGGSRYFLRVDAHDKHVVVPPGHPEYEALAELRRKNQSMVEAIESAWNEAELPTFTSCLNEDLAERESSSRSP